MNDNSIFRKKCSCKIRNIAGEIFLVPIHDNSIQIDNLFRINDSGKYIWSCIEEKESFNLNEITNSIVEFYETDRTEIESDVLEFLICLCEKNLIEECI